MHWSEQEMQTRDSSSTPSVSSTEDLIPSGIMSGNYNTQTMVITSDGSQHIYEDIDLQAPPKLAPSGVYTKGNSIIKKPIAFKPVFTSKFGRRSLNTPITGESSPFSSIESSDAFSNGNMSKSVNTKLTHSQSQYSLSQHSYFLEDDNWYSEIAALKLRETPGVSSFRSDVNGQESLTYDLAAQTPSPSDSGIAELEAMLREKDSEISYLRETLEHNEQVIFKVYEEKEQTWQRELKKFRSLYDSKLQIAQDKLAQIQQTMQMQNQQSQIDKQKLTTELDNDKQRIELLNYQIERFQSELSSLRSQLEETEWSLCQKTGEIALLKTQLKDSQGDYISRANEIIRLKTQLRQEKIHSEDKTKTILELREKLENFDSNSSGYSSHLGNIEETSNLSCERDHNSNLLSQIKQENKRLQQVISSLENQIENIKDSFEEERVQWLDEKEKVIRFQKQLQSNYIQMIKKNKQFENKIQQMAMAMQNDQYDHNETHC